MAFSSVEGLLQAAGQVPLWRAVLEDDLRERGVDEARSWRQMAALWTAMKAPVAEYDPAARSRSGLTGGAGARLEGEGPGLCPPFLRQVIAAANGAVELRQFREIIPSMNDIFIRAVNGQL